MYCTFNEIKQFTENLTKKLSKKIAKKFSTKDFMCITGWEHMENALKVIYKHRLIKYVVGRKTFKKYIRTTFDYLHDFKTCIDLYLRTIFISFSKGHPKNEKKVFSEEDTRIFWEGHPKKIQKKCTYLFWKNLYIHFWKEYPETKKCT